MLEFKFEPYSLNEKLTYMPFLFLPQASAAIPDLLNKIQSSPSPVVALRADMILSPFHLKSALYKATENFRNAKMKTRTIETEVLYSLTPNTKINDAFRLFGIKDYSGPVLIISFEFCAQKLTELNKYLESIFGSESLDFSEETLFRYSNPELVSKAYGLTVAADTSSSVLSQQIVSTMAMKWWL